MVNDIGFDMADLGGKFPEPSLDLILADYPSDTYLTINLSKEEHVYLASFFIDRNDYAKIKLGNTVLGFPPSGYKRPDEPFHMQMDVTVPVFVNSLNQILSSYKGDYDFITTNISRKDKKALRKELKSYK